jgi:Outer membrane protein beta-barrel domain
MRKLTWTSITLLAVLLVSGSVSAQSIWLGVHGGLSIPDLSGGGGNALSSNYTSRLAGNFGFQSDFGITKKFSIAIELNYAGQGGKRDGLQPITNLPAQYQSLVPSGYYLYANFKNVAALDYLELPILARLTWGKTWKFYVNAGPYLGYLLHGEEKTKGNSYIYEDPQGQDPLTVQGYPVPEQNFTANTNITSDIHKFNVGVTGGVGLAYPFGKNEIFLDVRGEYGLLNIQKYSADGKDNTGNLLISLGYSFRLGK